MQTDVLVIGCGIAGATAALRLSADGRTQVALLTRERESSESNSSWAQGGIVGLGENDSAELLMEDVLRAGAGLSSPAAVRLLAEEGPARMAELLLGEGGTAFDRDAAGAPLLGLEAAHSRRRILHASDRTGAAIMQTLLERLGRRENVRLLTERTAVDLVTFPHHSREPLAIYDPPACHGAYVFHRVTREVEPIVAAATVLATGGAGQVYLNTTNPPGARGDGLAMAARAGARIINAEYVQFHPTALHMPGTTKLLISEAVRGEGGVLLNLRGERFMERHAPQWKELAPRDVVARAIYWELLAADAPHVLLDIASHLPADRIRQRFPRIHAICLQHNLDITVHPIPVVPAAHYHCGGVLVDAWGRSSLPGLYAVGEVACTGVHGANRLASTSLLEGLLWGDRAARDILRGPGVSRLEESRVPVWDVSDLRFAPDPALIQGDMQTIRNLMWHYVGLVRSEHRLNRAIRELESLRLNIEDFYRRAQLSDGLIGLRNGVQAALLVAHAARRNRTSRGCHYREDARPSRA